MRALATGPVAIALFMMSSSALADNPRKSADHALPAEIARSEAVEAARLNRWADALMAIDKAIAIDTTWPELYLLRAGIHVGNAGVESDEASMKRMRPAANYDGITTSFAAAADDWTKYLELQPTAKERKTLIRAIGEYRALANVAKAHAVTKNRFQAQAAAHAAGKPATCYDGRVLVDELHCCWPSQKWNGSSCTGQCPSGFGIDATARNYGLTLCLPPIVRAARGTSPRCPTGQSLYEYRLLFWDEDVERIAQLHESLSLSALQELTKTRVAADHCQFLTASHGLACCP